MVTFKPNNLFQIFGIILLLLVSIGVISFTSKLLFGMGRERISKVTNYFFDSDLNLNTSRICPFSEEIYQIDYNRTGCYNKTLLHWHIPWIRYRIWREIEERNREKKRKRTALELLELIKNQTDNENENETNYENKTGNKMNLPDMTANQKSEEEPSKVVCTILAALLIISCIIAICEVLKDKVLKQAKAKNHRFSMSEAATLNDFLRQTMEVEKEACHSTPKVTQTLIHQSSLDRAFSRLNSEVKPPFLRRSSVPAHLLTSNPDEGTSFLKGQSHSAGVSPATDSPEVRRKNRHFIRRH